MGPDSSATRTARSSRRSSTAFAGAFKEVAEAVQGELRKIGIDLQIQLFDATVAWGKLATQEFDAFGMSFPYVSAGDALNLYFRSANRPTPNRMNWNDKETDELLDKGSQATDVKVRGDAYGAGAEPRCTTRRSGSRSITSRCTSWPAPS